LKYFVAISICFLSSFGYLYAQKPPIVATNPDQTALVRFYPNPAVNLITFEIKEPVQRGTNILVYSFLGRQVASIPVNTQRITVGLNNYFRGIYVFQVKSPSGKILETNKFQVNK
jgi:hypothetical protein